MSLLELLTSPLPKRRETGEVFVDEIDSCAICKGETPYTSSIHIDERECYIQGAGQLCKGCYFKNYVEKPKRIPDYFLE